MIPVRLRIDERGRLALPADLLEAVGIRPSSTVRIDIENGALKIYSFGAVLDKVRAKLRGCVRYEGIVDELIRDRHAERS